MSLIGWKFINPNINIASVRIRGVNLINYINKLDVGFRLELYNPGNLSRYKAVIFSKTYTKSDILLATRLKRNGQSVIFDICDNHFLLDNEKVLRLREMLSISDIITVSTSALKDVFVSKNVPENKIVIISDAIDEYMPRKSSFSIKGFFERTKVSFFLKKLENSSVRRESRLIWFGHHEGSVSDSGMTHLNKLKKLLTEINEQNPISLTILSNSKRKFDSIFSTWQIPCHYYEWNMESQSQILQAHQIAIIPIILNDFTFVKTNNRLVTAILNDLNVVADEIPSYAEFKSYVYLNSWEEGLMAYLTNSQKREGDLKAARELIKKKYSLNVIVEQWLKILS